jgi:hypothetical protein
MRGPARAAHGVKNPAERTPALFVRNLVAEVEPIATSVVRGSPLYQQLVFVESPCGRQNDPVGLRWVAADSKDGNGLHRLFADSLIRSLGRGTGERSCSRGALCDCRGQGDDSVRAYPSSAMPSAWPQVARLEKVVGYPL